MWQLPDDIDTPALVVDYDTLVSNIDTMAARLADRGVAVRPHAKTHKSPDVARLQVERGAAGLTVASLGEAEVFAAEGFDDLFIAYPLYVPGRRAARLRALAASVRLSVGVDSVESARMLAEASAAELTVVVEIDCGQHRTGVAPQSAGQLAGECASLGLRVGGVFTHGGHSYADPTAAAAAARDETEGLRQAAMSLEEHGIAATRVSAGSTPTAVASAAGPVTEERPGTYVFNDRQQLALGSADRGQLALAVAATVVSTSVRGQAVLDAGSKSLASDRPAWLAGHGIVPELGDAPVVSVSECHGVVQLGDQPAPAIGSIVRVVPNHVCTVVNLFDAYEVVSKGEIVDRWPVAARGHLS